MPPFPELKDISPPTPPPFSSPEEVQALVWQVFGGVTALLVIAGVWLWWRWRVRRSKAPPLPQPALDQLRERLAALQTQAGTAAPAALAEQVSQFIRTYLQREHGLMARYRTTEELLGTTRGPRRADAPPPLPFLRPFADVFPLCDTLKFAGSGASAAMLSPLIDRALAATEEVRIALAPRPVAAAASAPPLPPALPAPPDTAPAAAPPPVPPEAASAPAFAVGPPLTDPLRPAGAAPSRAGDLPRPLPPPLPPLPPPASLSAAPPGPPPFRAAPRSDSFTRPPTAAFARGADVIPA